MALKGKNVFLVCAAMVLLAGPAASQQVPATAPVIGGPPQNQAAQRLGPIPGSPFPTAADKLPIAKLKVPVGFKVEVYASGVPNARQLAVSDKGTVFAGSRLVGAVHTIRKDGGSTFVRPLVTGLHRPNGVVFHKGALYIAEISRILRIDNVESQLDSMPKPTVINEQFPKDEAHGWKFIAVGPDEKLYVPVGAPGNVLVPDYKTHSHIRRMNLDGSAMEVIVEGQRNTVGFDWNPVTGDMYFTDNGRDWVSEDAPEDELNRVRANGKKHFGFPYCHQGNFRDPEFGWGMNCADYEPPVTLLGAHAAALGMRFYTGNMFPAEYKNAAFIARHGAWNRTAKIGGDIVVAKFNPDGTVRSVEPFLSGFLENDKYVGRPVDVEQLADGSLLLSDDLNGAVYRISYAK